MELLVVISVISMLIAIMLPTLSRAKGLARGVFCLSNLRQLVMAANSYTCSNDNRYPLSFHTEKKDDVRYYYSWDFTSYKDWSERPAKEVVKPGYLWGGETIEEVHQCPSYKGGDNWLADPYTGYNYNTSYIGMDETSEPVGSAMVSEVGRPSETAIFGDGEYSGGANKFMRAPFGNPRDASFDSSSRVAGTQGYRHLDKTNVGFCDGHAEAWGELYTDSDPIVTLELEKYNEQADVKVGFLSEDNSIYDLK